MRTKVTKDDLTAIAKRRCGSREEGAIPPPTGDKGAEVVKKFEDNIKKNPNADTDAVEKGDREGLVESAKEEKSDAKTLETSDSKKQSDSGSSNGSKKDNGKTTGSPIILETRAIHPPRKTRENPIAKPSGGNSKANSGSNSNSGSSSKKG